MKLVIAAEIFPPDIGGPATYSLRLAEELAKKNWQVKLICYSDKIENDNYSFSVTRILRGASPIKHYFNYFWELLKLAKDCDVIYAQGPVGSGLPAVVVGFFLSKKVIVKVVGDYAWEQSLSFERIKNISIKDIVLIDKFQESKSGGKIGLLKKIERFVCVRANKVIIPSYYLRGIVNGWGIEKDKMEVIYNSTNLFDKFGAISREDARNKLGFQKDDFVIVSAGRGTVPWKGFGLLALTVAELIMEKGIPSRLRMLGVEGEEVIRIQQLLNDKVVYEVQPIKDSQYNAKILRINDTLNNSAVIRQSREKVFEYLLAADLFILNTGYEGLSHMVLEAMDAGVPVITTNVGGNPELIKDGENGLLIEYNNKEQLKEAIVKLYNNPELRQQFIINSKEVLKKFTFESMINQTIKTLESI